MYLIEFTHDYEGEKDWCFNLVTAKSFEEACGKIKQSPDYINARDFKNRTIGE